MRPTIQEAKDLQARLDLRETHVIWLGEEGFTMAHTDTERATISLEECDLHCWLVENGLPDEVSELGWYTAIPHQADAYSESFRGGACPWDFEPIRESDDPV